MRPDQLKYLTDEERRAWEALTTPRCGKGCDEYVGGYPQPARCGRDVNHDGHCDPDDSRHVEPHEHVAALEALADARRERDEARALLRHLAEAYRGTLVRAPSDHACTECVADKHLSDDAVESGFRCPYHELRAFITPGEDPAPRGAGAPDAAGGALGVGCSLCRHLALADAPKADACPLCGAAVSKGGALGVGVGLTNCDNCAHDYDVGDMRRCRVVDRDYSDADRTGQWANANTHEGTGIPLPGATGCPGWAKREG